MTPPTFFSELKRRNVYKVAVAYAIVGWLLVQVATQVLPFREIPIWVVRLVIVLVIAWGRRPIEMRSENISVPYPLISDF